MKRTSTVVLTLLLVVGTTGTLPGASAQDSGSKVIQPLLRTGSSYSAFKWAKGGAIQIERMRIPWEKVEEYMQQYNAWFRKADEEKDSGRELLAAVFKEHGDPYNVVFVYRYDHTLKTDYYCKYSKAFWTKNKAKFSFSAKESKAIEDAFATCPKTGVHTDLVDQIRKQDHELRKMVDLDEASWNREVDWDELP